MQENDAATRQPWAGGRVLESDDGRKMISFQLGRSTVGRRPSEEGQERISYKRRRRLAASDGMSLYSGLGTHYVMAHVGNPPQELSLVVDTGSFNMAFPCDDCEGCRGGQQDLWDPSTSRTARVLSCGSCQGSSYKLAEAAPCWLRNFYLGEVGTVGGLDEWGAMESGPLLWHPHHG